MAKQIMKVVNIEDARIGYRNFAGNEGPFNRKGDRNFSIFLDEDRAQELKADGWNVKWPKPNERIDPAEDERRPWLQVAVAFENVPPKIVLIAGENVTILEEDQVGTLDHADAERIDLILNPYVWNVNGKTGVKAYLKAMYVTLTPDPFSSRYGI